MFFCVNTVFQVGLPNPGNNCFQNCILQSLVRLEGFKRIFKDTITWNNDVDDDESNVAQCLQIISNEGFTDGKSNWNKTIGKLSELTGKYISGTEQQGAHEYLQFLIFQWLNSGLLRCEKEINYDNLDILKYILKMECDSSKLEITGIHPLVLENFYCSTISYSTCAKCKKTKSKLDLCGIINLHLPEKVNVRNRKNNLTLTLETLLSNNYQNVETVQAVYCSPCNMKNKRSTETFLDQLSPTVIINFKREDINKTKDTRPVDLPSTIDLGSLTKGEIPSIYELKCVVEHFGDVTGNGHYVTYVVNDVEGERDTLFNDEKVYDVYPDKRNNCPSIAFYEKVTNDKAEKTVGLPSPLEDTTSKAGPSTKNPQPNSTDRNDHSESAVQSSPSKDETSKSEPSTKKPQLNPTHGNETGPSTKNPQPNLTDGKDLNKTAAPIPSTKIIEADPTDKKVLSRKVNVMIRNDLIQIEIHRVEKHFRQLLTDNFEISTTRRTRFENLIHEHKNMLWNINTLVRFALI